MNPADILAALSIVNGLVINGQKLAITMNGVELNDEQLKAYIESAIVQIELNRDTD